MGTHASTLPLALAVAGIAALAAAPARGQVSPGPLAAAHAALDGSLQCFQCHGGGKAMDGRCLACHTEVAWMRTHRRGVHASVADRACAKCHPDHAGRDFRLIAWGAGSPEKFDHREAGWILEGRHAAAECRACHRPEFQRSGAVPLLRKKDRSQSWLGLESACASCHRDPHGGQLGADCIRCHDARAWKPAAGFDHSRTRYPLAGKHAEVACEKCHLAPSLTIARDAKGAPIPLYRPLAHAECSACHRDPHQNRFGGACASCHSTDGFHVIRRQGFNHDRTRYPLRGRHAALECAICHDPKKAWGAKPAFARCGSCHRDAHGGQATIEGRPADCEACHRVEGFRPSSFTVAQHRASRYPLEGAHVRAECAACHGKVPTEPAATLGASHVRMRPAYEACTECHSDPHAGRFAAGGERPRKAGCASCHDVGRFRPSSVDVAAHDAATFRLEGAHRATPCQACHAELRAAPAASSLAGARAGRPLLFRERARVCDDCHESPHGDQFAARRDHGACEGCHGLDAFVPAGRFDHRRDSVYPLEGAHARAACASCHRPAGDAAGKRRTIYRPTPVKCESCHASPPSGTLRKASLAPSHIVAPATLSLLDLPEAHRETQPS